MRILYKTILVIGLYLSFLLSDISFAASLNPQKADQAAETILQEDHKETAKEIYGDFPETNQMIDQAREKASQKLKNLADKAEESNDPEATLPPNEKNFLKKFD